MHEHSFPTRRSSDLTRPLASPSAPTYRSPPIPHRPLPAVTHHGTNPQIPPDAEWIHTTPCTGTLYLSTVASAVRNEVCQEHTSLSWPKPTQENGLPEWPCTTRAQKLGIGVRFRRIGLCDPLAEVEMVRTIRRACAVPLQMSPAPGVPSAHLETNKTPLYYNDNNIAWTPERILSRTRSLQSTFVQPDDSRPVLFSRSILLRALVFTQDTVENEKGVHITPETHAPRAALARRWNVAAKNHAESKRYKEGTVLLVKN
jgi:hypothetical protein